MDRRVIKALRAAGWEHVATRGDHHKFRDPATGRTTTIPHPVKDLPTGTLRAIEKQTGLELH